MAVQNTYLTNDGDLGQAKRKRAGESVGIGDVPGDPARAARMEAQFAQPVTKVTQAGGSGGGGIGGTVERVKSAYSAVSPLINPLGTVADVLTATPADALRNSAIRAAGGDPATAEGGETANRDRAFGKLMPAVNLAGSIADTVGQGVKRSVLAATGASPAPEPAATPSTQPAVSPGKPATSPAKPTADPVPESPYFATGTGQIAARMNGSTPEFTNDPTAVAGARAMPTGGRGSPLLAPGVSNLADDVPLEQRGSINNVGNGVGGFSQNTQGDAALALGRFERANQEREKMVQVSRRGGIGEGGGRVTVVRDSSRAPSITETLRDQQDARLAQTEALRSQSQQSIMAGAEQLMTSQVNRQKTQQEIETGRAGLENQQRIADLRSMIADTTLPVEQRQAAEQAYNALTLSPADRYMTVQGGTNEFGGKDASKVFDRLTGREVGKTDNPSMAADLEQARRVIAADPSKRAEVEKRLQQAYGRGLEE